MYGWQKYKSRTMQCLHTCICVSALWPWNTVCVTDVCENMSDYCCIMGCPLASGLGSDWTADRLQITEFLDLARSIFAWSTLSLLRLTFFSLLMFPHYNQLTMPWNADNTLKHLAKLTGLAFFAGGVSFGSGRFLKRRPSDESSSPYAARATTIWQTEAYFSQRLK